MRNLKRALSLGLTAAMISGLMVMGSSAASYADVTSENNVEAIEVLEAVGIMIGDENGDFNPDAEVTRNEMAVIMSNLLDYKVSTFLDHPHLEAQFVENPEPTSPFRTKALGEPPACPVAPAIRNAVLNATGVEIDRIPMTPHVLFQRFTEEGLIQDPWRKEG